MCKNCKKNNSCKYQEDVRVSDYLAKLGISVFNECGEFRSLEDILEQCINIQK